MKESRLLPACLVALLCSIRLGEALKCHQCFWSKFEVTGELSEIVDDLALNYADEDCKQGGNSLPIEEATECSNPFYIDNANVEVYCSHSTVSGNVRIELFDTTIEIEGGARDCTYYDPDFSITARPSLECVADDELNPFNDLAGDGLFTMEMNIDAEICHCITDGCNGAGHLTLSLGSTLLAAVVFILWE